MHTGQPEHETRYAGSFITVLVHHFETQVGAILEVDGF